MSVEIWMRSFFRTEKESLTFRAAAEWKACLLLLPPLSKNNVEGFPRLEQNLRKTAMKDHSLSNSMAFAVKQMNNDIQGL